MKVESVKKSCLKPMPKIIVSCRGKDKKDNALVVGYAGNCSYAPPMVMIGIVPSRYSYHIIKETGCFVINIASSKNKEMYDYLGKISGRDEDKFKVMNIKTEDGKFVNAPILTDCPVNIECTVVDSIMTGSHEMFIGKVEYVHADKELVDEKGIYTLLD
jgi:flavin reductase (DIM6/NTAB) family NADH-FMN oxidoreductase RutF